MRTPRAPVVLLGSCLLLAACFSGRPVGGPTGGSPPLGSFAVTSQALGEHTLVPSGCTAGDRQVFLGADFSDATGPLVVRLVVDPLDGPAVRVFSTDAQFDETVVFRRSDCQVFHFSLERTGWRINDVTDYRVTLQLDCSRPGESLKGSASSTHCS